MPHMPTPLRKSQVMATSRNVATAPPIPKMANQPIGVCEFKDDTGDLFGDGLEGLAFGDDAVLTCCRIDTRHVRLGFVLFQIQWLPWINPSPCVQRGRLQVLRSGSGQERRRWCGGACSGQRGPGRCARRLLSFATLLALSLRLPKVMALAGQACWHAVTTSPSRMSRFSLSEGILASLMRWTQ